MDVLFNEKIARSYDRWAETPRGRKAYEMEGELVLQLGKLTSGDKLLEVGSGTGLHLEIFLKAGLNVVGVDISPFMLQASRKRVGFKGGLCLADALNLPFQERSFDIVAMLTTLEFISDPVRAVQEAFRVSRGLVLLGVLNKYSFLAITRRFKGIFRPNILSQARFYSIWELQKLIRAVCPEAAIQWASILVLPMSWQCTLTRLERRLSLRRNPLGAFLGLRVSLMEACDADIRSG